jgi:1,4-alpha-glucan branching enzyme
VRIHAPFARTVEIAGDFTAWEPRALVPLRDGWWETIVAVAPGVHQLNWRTDGGAWRVPPGLEAMRDDYDGTVGVLVIPSP